MWYVRHMDDRRSSHQERASEVAEHSPDELPPFTAEERALFMASLEVAEQEIQQGDCVEYDKATFLADLIATFQARKRAKGA